MLFLSFVKRRRRGLDYISVHSSLSFFSSFSRYLFLSFSRALFLYLTLSVCLCLSIYLSLCCSPLSSICNSLLLSLSLSLPPLSLFSVSLSFSSFLSLSFLKQLLMNSPAHAVAFLFVARRRPTPIVNVVCVYVFFRISLCSPAPLVSARLVCTQVYVLLYLSSFSSFSLFWLDGWQQKDLTRIRVV